MTTTDKTILSNLSAPATAAPVTKGPSYGDAMAAGERAEREGDLASAIEAYDEALGAARRTKRSTKDASTAYLRVEAAVKAAGLAGTAVGATKTELAQQLAGNPTAEANERSYEAVPAVKKAAKAGVKAKPLRVAKKVDPAERKDADELVRTERARVKQNGIKHGDTLRHVYRGLVQAEVLYKADRLWVYDGREFTSISAAANACAADLGSKSRSLNGWVFWGVEKREA